MQLRRITTLSMCLLTSYALLCPNSVTWADAFVRFFAQQKVGQKITVTGGFRRFPTRPKKQYFVRDSKTGDVEYMEYFGMTIVPLYFDQGQVKDLPLKGESFWFTGTLIGYQYGTTGITRGVGVGGDPYILLRSVSGQPPEDLPMPTQKKRREDGVPPEK